MQLSKVAREFPKSFTSIEGLFDTVALQLRYFPVFVLNLLIATSRLSPVDQVALNVTIFSALTTEKYIDYTYRLPTQNELEQFLLPYRARTQSFADNAKVSLILEQIFTTMLVSLRLESTDALRSAVEVGIRERSHVKGKRDDTNEDAGEAMLMTSAKQLNSLVQMLSVQTNTTLAVASPPKKRQVTSVPPSDILPSPSMADECAGPRTKT